ncbi:hypothetical protein D0T12_03715 [Actinomadura spongiicola]|uniref:Secreted protein n=1 Tax=Actinomadura spongiicola TaxID=2303421 RepID=A0A372GPR1_9ACTN|nr:hypothetical protein [Actinomadura spongiicola]RFS87350.1 hypothetical protein D0T12_03715 [Actinomadura spongiicola]
MTGAAVLVTAMSGAGIASARTTDTVCGPEHSLGSVVYKNCSVVLGSWDPEYGTMPFLELKNLGIAETTVTVTHERWNYTTNSWEYSSGGSKTIFPFFETQYYSLSHGWSCGQDAKERARITSTVGTGDWSEAVTTSPC